MTITTAPAKRFQVSKAAPSDAKRSALQRGVAYAITANWWLSPRLKPSSQTYFAHRAGYSYAEIAEHMNVSQRTIRRHVARALLAIMEHGDL